MKIAVYGTLKRGWGNHRLLTNARYIGTGWTDSGYEMRAQAIPYVSRKEGAGHVLAEVYEVTPSELVSLDALEGHPDWYRREEVAINLFLDENDEEIPITLCSAEMYLNEDGAELPVVSSGIFGS